MSDPNDSAPSPNGPNGKGGRGRFVKGNPGGPGNPNAKRVAELRSALFSTVSPQDLKVVVTQLLNQAKAGEIAAIKELLQRLLGPAESIDLLERLELLEAKLAQIAERDGPTWGR